VLSKVSAVEPREPGPLLGSQRDDRVHVQGAPRRDVGRSGGYDEQEQGNA